MNTMMDFFHAHPFVLPVALVVFIQFSNSLPAPTAKDSKGYVIFFRFITGLGNIARAWNTKIETSPNWQAAVTAHVDKMNGASGQIAQKP